MLGFQSIEEKSGIIPGCVNDNSTANSNQGS